MTSLQVISNRRLSTGTFCLRVTRPDVDIRAGQCFSVGLAELAVNREYSIYSGVNDDYLEFLIREIADGVVSPRLAKCEVGDEVEVGGPYGEFCLQDDHVRSRHFVFIASGTGVAPFHSYVMTYGELDYTVFHGVRHREEGYDVGDYRNDGYHLAVSRPDGSENSRRVTDLLETHELSPDSLYYLCGNQQMITDAITVLRRRGIPGGSIFTETFF